MRMGQGVRTDLGHGGITCVLQTQFSSLFIIIVIIIISIIIAFVDGQLNVVMPGSHIPEHVSRDSRIPPASTYRK